MLEEIHEQPGVIAETLEGRIHNDRLMEESFGHTIIWLLDQTDQISIVACGTSFHAGLVAKYWLEEVGIPCQVETASDSLPLRQYSIEDVVANISCLIILGFGLKYGTWGKR